MKFMTMIRSSENAGMPPQSLFDAIDALIAEQARTGVLVDAGGLAPEAQAARVRVAGGRLRVTDGPFAESKEVIGGYAIVNAASRADAVRMAEEVMQLHIEHWPEFEGECEVREIVG